ncbi:MAG TPA: hypothetical protein VN193_09860 [Candidatus Angelobacter sp.]|jgi:hypothetical protein|nr:hypothetical protein [Candidatus Angelobacter sp.]
MTDEIDDTTAALVGHALVRWIVNEDPAGVDQYVPELEPSEIDDAKAARIGRTMVELLQRIDVA